MISGFSSITLSMHLTHPTWKVNLMWLVIIVALMPMLYPIGSGAWYSSLLHYRLSCCIPAISARVTSLWWIPLKRKPCSKTRVFFGSFLCTGIYEHLPKCRLHPVGSRISLLFYLNSLQFFLIVLLPNSSNLSCLETEYFFSNTVKYIQINLSYNA